MNPLSTTPTAATAHSGLLTRRFAPLDILLFMVILHGELFRLLLPFHHNPINAIWSDPGRWWSYVRLGVETPPMALIDPIFYQAWLAFISKFTLDIPGLVALYAGLLSAITPWLWYRFLRELLPRKREALIGWALLAWLPSWIGIYGYFMTETLLLPLLGLALWLSWRSLRKGTTTALLLAALIWILASLTRGVAAPMAAVVTLGVWWYQVNRLQAAVGVAALVLLALAPLSYRSYVKTGTLTPLGQPGLNQVYALSGKREIKVHYHSDRNVGFLYGFASPSTGSQPLAPFSDYTNSREGTVEVYIDLDNQAESWAGARERVGDSGPPRHQIIAEELLFLFFGTSWPDNNPARAVEWVGNWMRFIWLPLFVAALLLLGYRLWQRRYFGNATLLALLLTWLLVQGVMLFTVNEGRYRKPIEGVLICALLLGVAGSRRPPGAHPATPALAGPDPLPADREALPAGPEKGVSDESSAV